MFVTNEPGIYFMPMMQKKFREDEKLRGYFNWDKVDEYTEVGGVRIEDDVLITEDGHEVYYEGIPRTCDEIEAWMANNN